MILLGASNVTLGFGVLTRLIRGGFGERVDVYAALGHGRSYGVWSSLAARSLPSIVNCGLWERLDGEPRRPTYALLTDVGNDLMYGFMPEQIDRWVGTCLDRLSALDAKVVVTRLPIARVERLGPLRYHATRASFFPRHKPIAWTEMLRRACELDERVRIAAAQCGAAVVTPPLEWYGFDPIHIRWSRRTPAWRTILSHWPGFEHDQPRRAKALSILGRFPEHMRLFGREKTTPQPIIVRDDVTVSLY